ncbi:hypothetical protein KKG58_01755 [Patescibacteria group bacterium]|nr:hypothetical protein [Patescibacteria group bacterium]
MKNIKKLEYGFKRLYYFKVPDLSPIKRINVVEAGQSVCFVRAIDVGLIREKFWEKENHKEILENVDLAEVPEKEDFFFAFDYQIISSGSKKGVVVLNDTLYLEVEIIPNECYFYIWIQETEKILHFKIY